MVIEITITSAPHCTKSRGAATFAQLCQCAVCHNNTAPRALSSHLLHQHCLRRRTAVQYSLYMYMFATKLLFQCQQFQ